MPANFANNAGGRRQYMAPKAQLANDEGSAPQGKTLTDTVEFTFINFYAPS